MPAAFPHRYEVSLKRTGPARGLLSAPPRPDLVGTPPPEFDGPAESWSPEHLLLSAASLCLMTTFAAVAAKSKLTVLDYRSRAEGTLDKTPEGLRFTAIVLKVELTVPPGEKDRAARLLETAKKHCIVSNALRVPETLEASVSEAAAAPAGGP